MPQASQASESGDFEELLMRPAEVIGQRDDTSGCGAACLEMILGLEHRGAVDIGTPPDESPFPQCLEAAHPEDAPFVWRCRPSTLVEAINGHGGTGPPRALGLRQYHVVHGASLAGPLEEVIAWLRGWPTMDGPLRRPSALLVHHGAHWMLAVGARVESGALQWMALADPAAGSLICLTPDGLREIFTPNTIGSHPDWFGRHVAVVPSFLPRPRPTNPAACGTHRPPPSAPLHHRATAITPASPFALSSEDASPLLETLHHWAHSARHPLVASWLGPLASARFVVIEDPPSSSASSNQTPSARRSAQVLDSERQTIATIRYRVDPPTILQCAVNTGFTRDGAQV